VCGGAGVGAVSATFVYETTPPAPGAASVTQ
jgi:hypothetical protein